MDEFSDKNKSAFRLTVNIGVPIIGDMNLPDIISSLQKIGLTQSQIAESIGCGQSTVSDIATGKIGGVRPSYKVVSGLKALARKHRVSIVGIKRASEGHSA